jgi:colanic acid biosynthesis glycosyl transferase WcaI
MAKILIHSIVFKPDGVSTAYLYADLVAELKKHGHELTVLTSTPHYNYVADEIKRQPLTKHGLGTYYTSDYNGVKVYHIPMRKAKNTSARIVDFVKFHIFSIILGSRLGKFDIVLAPSPPLTIGLAAYIISKLCHAKSIYNVQEIYPDFAINQGVIRNKFAIKTLKLLERYIYKKSASVTVIDQKFADIISPRITKTTKLKVIPNFVDTDFYTPQPRKNEFSAKYLLDDKFVIAYAGNIGFAQNWDPIIEACLQVQNLPIVFLIVGDGVKKKWLQDQIEKKDIKNLLLLGYQAKKFMPLINASANIHTILMNSDMDGDGFPSKIYTIMSSAKSVIISTGEHSPLFKLMKNAGCTRRVPLNDNDAYVQAVKLAYEERNLLDGEGKTAREFIIKNFSKEIVARQYHELINTVIDEK